jgi:hypothetical protein
MVQRLVENGCMACLQKHGLRVTQKHCHTVPSGPHCDMHCPGDVFNMNTTAEATRTCANGRPTSNSSLLDTSCLCMHSQTGRACSAQGHRLLLLGRKPYCAKRGQHFSKHELLWKHAGSPPLGCHAPRGCQSMWGIRPSPGHARSGRSGARASPPRRCHGSAQTPARMTALRSAAAAWVR